MPSAPVNAGMSAQAESLKKINEQLRRELKINRQKVSECAQDIISFCEKEQRSDPLIYKVPASENPYRERGRGCSLL
ncbi:guanine nucleotide-binding protein G(I)/G(S)/G(O) subunit gamma-8-like [Hydractinia symbiolongicarpus]|uniref:guanine nucleotide-binding protein G(I)/G(S)/G(O) subunit gamma-8-like n=1 Tax=Hydractinia symbiolongicarpus TaxID=13093 RepID=UPI00254FDA67|nr:guanine nucleotide-binding protein G(I)/G(S)/G(O) subunit gamma-8-like [Hydractinia symbiolongicarpus]